MVRVTKKGIKFFSYATALVVGAVLVVFGVQAKSDGEVATGELQKNLLGETATADHFGDSVGDTFGGDDGDDDDGGGDGGG